MSDKKMPSTFGATFAERKAAANGEKTFTAPEGEPTQVSEPSTFASRKAIRESENKAVKAPGTDNKGGRKKAGA